MTLKSNKEKGGLYMGFIKKKKSGKVVVKIPQSRAHSLSEGNHIGVIRGFDLKKEDGKETEHEILTLILEVEEISIRQRIFINFEQDCPFTQLLDVLAIENDQYIDFNDFLGIEIGFRLKQRGDYLNISKIFPPDADMHLRNLVD